MHVFFAGAHAIASTGVCSLKQACLIQSLAFMLYIILYKRYFKLNPSAPIESLVTVNTAMILGAYYG